MAIEIETPEGAEGGAAAPAPKKSKKMLFIIIGAVLFLSVAGGAAAYFMGAFSPKHVEGEEHAEGDEAHAEKAEGEAAEEKADPNKIVNYKLPDMIVNLQSERNRPSFLKISMSLELAKAEDQPAVEKALPRIVDAFQIYLRELRVDEVRGSAGLFRLREELLMRVQQVVAPLKVRDVLFGEILVQ